MRGLFVIASEAKQSRKEQAKDWIASSQELLAMTAPAPSSPSGYAGHASLSATTWLRHA
jgi:hypothetical protein